MSSEKPLPSVDLMSCQHGGEVIPSMLLSARLSRCGMKVFASISTA
ncbi:hypothetical protein AB2G28_24535 (plasmid) [Escherichia coli]